MRSGSTAKVLAKCMLKYYRISECSCIQFHAEEHPAASGMREILWPSCLEAVPQQSRQ